MACKSNCSCGGPNCNTLRQIADQAAYWARVAQAATQGSTGATGVEGPVGATGSGATGATGVIGPVGLTGSTGPIGLTGATGASGLRGATGLGATGATGLRGATGATGDLGATGSAGSTGPEGATGSTGPEGATGSTGATGDLGPALTPKGSVNTFINLPETGNEVGDLYQVIDTLDFYGWDGSVWVNLGPVPVGATGIQGATGATGSTGVSGVDGATGATGIGEQGATGATGVGATGATGATGPAADTSTFVQKSGDTMTGKLNLPASSPAFAPLNLGNGVSPTSPVAGDLYFDGNLRYRDNVATVRTVAATNKVNVFSDHQSIAASNNSNPALTISQTGNGGGLKVVTTTGTGDCIRVEDDNPILDVPLFIVNASGRVGIGNLPDATVALSVDTTGIKFGDGTIQTTASIAGTGGATGAGIDEIFWQNGQTVNTSYSIPVGINAGSFGPITIASGVTVTVPSGGVWTVV